MIIIEGMDNTGKSTIAKYLSRKFNLTLIKSPKKRDNIVANCLELMERNPQVVLDRFGVISEMVYGPIIRGKNAFDSKSINHEFYLGRLVDCKPLILFCRPHEKYIFDFGSTTQMKGVISHKNELLEAYDNLMIRLAQIPSLLVSIYDYNLLDSKSFAELSVKNYLKG